MRDGSRDILKLLNNNTYEIGRKVYVKMNGLTIGLSNGVVSIGKGDSNRVKQLQASEFRNVVIRGAEVATLTPKVANIQDLTEKDENTLIQLNNMQVNRFDLASTYAGESTDEFDGFRILESCDNKVSILMQTSTFAATAASQHQKMKPSPSARTAKRQSWRTSTPTSPSTTE